MNIIVLLGKSGSGKDAMQNLLIDYFKKFEIVKLTSTRPMRENEKQGDPYFFTTKDNFLNNLNNFIEYRKYTTLLKNVKDEWYYGVSKDGDYYKKLEEQTSMITVAESGAGKSNLLNLLLYSIFWNYNNGIDSKIDYTVLIDLKGNELSLYNYKNTKFIDNIEGVETIFKELKEIMYNRYKIMKETGDKKFKGLPIIVVIDEVGTIGTYFDKRIKDNIFNDMIELFQKGRACKIIFMIFAQKCDSTNIPSNVLTNIQSRVLMKTDSDFNTNSMIGTKETIEEITLQEVANFNRGRAIIKDGESSKKDLIQVPFISENQHLAIVKSFNYLK